MQKNLTLLMLFFLFPLHAQAAPVLQDKPEIQKALSLRIPEIYGKVFSRYKAEPFAAPFVILIQDEHKSLESQMKIAELLNYLALTLGTEQIFVEGSEGRVDVALAATFPYDRTRERVAGTYLREGKVSGAEYEVIAHNTQFHLFGIERPSDYRYQYEAFFDCLLFQMQHRKELLYIEEILRRAKYFDLRSEDLLLLDEWKQDYREGSLPVEDLIQQILPLADKYAIQLSGYPQLDLFQAGKDWYDRNLLYEESARIITAIEGRIANHTEKYLLIAAANGYSLMRSIIEMNTSTAAALNFFEKSPDQKMTWEKIDQIFRVRYPDQSPIDLSVLNEMLEKARIFYEYGARREQVMAALLLRQARAEDLQTALCVVGRHHTQGISEALKREGISHYVITPNVNSFEQTIPYESHMLGKQTGMEAFLAGASGHLRMPSKFHPILDQNNNAFLNGLVSELYAGGFGEAVIEKISEGKALRELFQSYEKKLQEWQWQGISRVESIFSWGKCLYGDGFGLCPDASIDGKPVILFFFSPKENRKKTEKILKGSFPVATNIFFAEDRARKKIQKRFMRAGFSVKEEELLADNDQDHTNAEREIERQVQEDLELRAQEELL